MQGFRNLEVWHLSRALTKDIYALVKQFPDYEKYGLCSQLRRSAASIGANIVEAFGRGSRADAARCLQNAISEAGETLHHLITANDVEYLARAQFDEFEAKVEQIRRKLWGLFFKVRPQRRGKDSRDRDPR
jgi:four helix bundle protein